MLIEKIIFSIGKLIFVDGMNPSSFQNIDNFKTVVPVYRAVICVMLYNGQMKILADCVLFHLVKVPKIIGFLPVIE